MKKGESATLSRVGLLRRILVSTACLAFGVLVTACGSVGAGEPAAVPAEAASAEDPTEPESRHEAPQEAANEVQHKKVHSNRIRWKTASELNNFGYDVYRGVSPEGPFERLNPEVIEGAGTTDEPTAYEYVDRTIDPHETYFYYVESISMNGVRERFTPVAETKPKIQPSADETGSDGEGGP